MENSAALTSVFVLSVVMGGLSIIVTLVVFILWILGKMGKISLKNGTGTLLLISGIACLSVFGFFVFCGNFAVQVAVASQVPR